MDDLLKFALEKGGIIALLIIIVIVLWYQYNKNSVLTKDIIDKLIRSDEQRQEQILILIKQMYELQKNTQDTLNDMRRTQELMLIKNGSLLDSETLDILKKLDKTKLRAIAQELDKEE